MVCGFSGFFLFSFEEGVVCEFVFVLFCLILVQCGDIIIKNTSAGPVVPKREQLFSDSSTRVL